MRGGVTPTTPAADRLAYYACRLAWAWERERRTGRMPSWAGHFAREAAQAAACVYWEHTYGRIPQKVQCPHGFVGQG